MKSNAGIDLKNGMGKDPNTKMLRSFRERWRGQDTILPSDKRKQESRSSNNPMLS